MVKLQREKSLAHPPLRRVGGHSHRNTSSGGLLDQLDDALPGDESVVQLAPDRATQLLRRYCVDRGFCCRNKLVEPAARAVGDPDVLLELIGSIVEAMMGPHCLDRLELRPFGVDDGPVEVEDDGVGQLKIMRQDAHSRRPYRRPGLRPISR